jgi:hypothetical protein
MKFRKRVKLFPGVTLNLSKSGISTTIGVPGASVNFNRNGSFLNTGIPGTGLYDRQRIGGKSRPTPVRTNPQAVRFPQTSPKPTLQIPKVTENIENITTQGLQGLKETLLECYQEKLDLTKEIQIAKEALKKSQRMLKFSYFILIGLFIKWFKQNTEEKEADLNDLEKQFSECHVDIDIKTNPETEQKYLSLLESYKDLLSVQSIWDITAVYKFDNTITRSPMSESITRKRISFGFGNLDLIRTKFNALHFENADGGDLYVYPAFVAVVDSSKSFALVDIREISFEFTTLRFMEREGVPSDASVVGSTWQKVNKDGSPDRRFRDNYQIPICLYGQIDIKSTTGLHETYCFSAHEKAKLFVESFELYRKEV